MSNEAEALNKLEQVVEKLNERDQKFARDLILRFDENNYLSSKQMYWVGELTRRASAQPIANGEREKIEVGEFAKMIALFDNASKKLKKAAVKLRDENEGDVVISVATEKSRHPGTLNVATVGGYGNNRWFGRILKDGQFEISPKNRPNQTLVTLLLAFAADPAKVAAEYGKMVGRCSFCNKHLSDERSTYIGYGPVCAENWNLPWGTPEQVTLQLLSGKGI